MLDFERYEALTFDCYGTLVDWETGMLGALKPLLSQHGVELDDDAILDLFAEFEAELEQGEYKPYRHVLEQVVQKFGERFGFSPSEAEKSALPDSIKQWLPFSDTVDALKTLKQKYKLVILSNVDDDLFADTAKHLQVPFDQVITAQQVQSYKPSLYNFKTMMQRLGLPSEKILHVGASIYHDVIPASSLGLSTVFVDRRKDGSSGAAKAAEGKPDLQVPDLATLAKLAQS
ncbi:MAG: haloacid dehalogenase type II [Leptolyngbya sp. IPPAS B-1204]|nr:haloacid dehalogenase type II [Elainella sp. C42_A2020_010]RNJ69302.1 MAG: haloacid dehalogenase type II [Leptolyngbya sp. IPPAS B-1204]